MKDLENRRKLDEALMRAGARPRFGAITPPPPVSDPFQSGPGLFAPRHAPEPRMDTMGYLRWRGGGGDFAEVNPFADLAPNEPPPELDFGPIGGPVSTAQNEPASAPNAPEFDVDQAWDESGANGYLPRTGVAAFVPNRASEPRLDVNAYLRGRAGIDTPIGTLTGAAGFDDLRGGAGEDLLTPRRNPYALSANDTGAHPLGDMFAPLPAPYRTPMRPTLSFEELQPAEDEFFAERGMGQAQAERDLDDSMTPMGLGYVARPLTNLLTDPERQESVTDFAGDIGEGLMDFGAGVADYFTQGRAERDARGVVQAAPRFAQEAPEMASRAAGEAQSAWQRGAALAGDVFSTLAPDITPENAAAFALTAPRQVQQQVGQAAVDYGPGLAEDFTIGPWLDERQHQRDLDYARELGDEEAMNSAADAANIDTAFAGLNLAFAPGDIAAAAGVRSIGRAGERLAAPGMPEHIGEDLGQGYRLFDFPDGSVEVRGERGSPMRFSTRAMADDLLPDILGRGDDEVLQARQIDDGVFDVPESAPFGDDVPLAEPRPEIGVFNEAPVLRSLRTPEAREEWAGEALVREPADGNAPYDVYGFRGPDNSEFAVKVEPFDFDNETSATLPRGISSVSFEDLSRSNLYDPWDAQGDRFTATEARQILNRVVAAIEEDARSMGRAEYVLQPSSPEHARVYAAMSRGMQPPPGYSVAIGPEQEIRITRSADAPEPSGASRLEQVGSSEFLPEAIRRMPLLEGAPIVGAGATGAAAGAGFTDNAEASDGDPLADFDPTIPILGGVGGATLAAILRRNPGMAREMGSVVGANGGAAPQRRMLAAIRDPETGRIYTGANHADALGAAPEEAWPRLERAYAENGADVGFTRGDEFLTRDEALASLGEGAFGRAHPPRDAEGRVTSLNDSPQRQGGEAGTQGQPLRSHDPASFRDDVRFWDERLTDQENFIARLAMTGRSDREIASALAEDGIVVSDNQVAVVVNRIRTKAPDIGEMLPRSVRGSPPKDVNLERVREMRAHGARMPEIARALGVSTKTLYNHLNRTGALAALGLGAGALAWDEAEADEMSAEDALDAYGPETDYQHWTRVNPRGRVSSDLERLAVDTRDPNTAYYTDPMGRVFEAEVTRGSDGEELSIRITSELVPPPDGSDAAAEGGETFDDFNVAPAVNIGLGTLAGAMIRRRPVVSALTAAGVTTGLDQLQGGDHPYEALLAAGLAPVIRPAAALTRDTLRAVGPEAGRIAAYADTLSNEPLRARGVRIENDPIFGPRANLPFDPDLTVPALDRAYGHRTRIPGEEALEQGFGAELGEGVSQRAWFEQLAPAEQLRAVNSVEGRAAQRAARLADYLDSRRPREVTEGDLEGVLPPVAEPPSGGAPLSDIDLTGRFDRRGVPIEEMLADPEGRAGRLAQRLGSRPAKEVARQLAEQYGVPIGKNVTETARNLLRAAQTDKALQAALQRAGALGLIGAIAGLPSEEPAIH